MKSKTFTLTILSLLSIVLVAGLANAAEINSDNFDGGNLNGWTVSPAGSWTNTGNFAESRSVENAILQKTFSTTGFQSIIVKYDRQLGEDGSGSWTGDDSFTFSWSSDGTNFIALEEVVESDNPDDEDFITKEFSLPSGANDNSQFTIKFECSTNDAQDDEFCRVDNVIIEGTPISTNSGLTLTKTQEMTKTQSGRIEIRNTGTDAITSILFAQSGDFDVTISPSSISSLEPNEVRTITITPVNPNDIGFGENSVTISATGRNTNNEIVTAQPNIEFSLTTSFCIAGKQGNDLEIRDVDINNNGEGDDEEWILLDEIEVDVDVENNGDESINDVFVEIALIDSNGVDQTGELEFLNDDDEEIDLRRLSDDERDTASFRFFIPADFDLDGSYRLAVKVYSDDLGEEVECEDNSDDLPSMTIDRETDEGRFIAFEDIEISPSPATCNEPVTLQMDVFNIGDGGEEERVRINLFNTELGIDKSVEVRNLDEGDDARVRLDFTVPANAENKIYQLRASAEYEYDNGDYDRESDEDTLIPLEVIGCGPSTGDRIADITARLDSTAEAGGELRVTATITNLENRRTSFSIDTLGFQSWASLNSVSERVFDLDAGQSKEITLSFNVNNEASGQESFLIEIRSTEGVESREVLVNIQEPSTGLDFGDNTYLWIIGIVNVILIILIIVVAVRVSRR